VTTPSWNPFQHPDHPDDRTTARLTSTDEATARHPGGRTESAIGTIEQFQRIDKPWGYEQITAVLEGKYVGKVLSITAGSALSLQHHLQKEETVAVESGRVSVELGPDPAHLQAVTLDAGQGLLIRARVVHRITAITDARLLETSTAPPGWREDIVRHQDRYGRQGTSGP
jgi:mannose-6-phosphate isomerase-like protein (cupin superfamily)